MYALLRRFSLVSCGALGFWLPMVSRAQQVGTSKDGCDKSEMVKLQGSDRNHQIAAGKSDVVPLPSFTTEITWFCGDERETAANGRQFNEVRIARAANGAITWRFRVAQEPETPAPGGTSGPEVTTTVGFSKDGCDRTETVRFEGRSGPAVVTAPIAVRRVRLNGTVKEFTWFCGDEEERAANDVAFNVVVISRANNGAIDWRFDRVEEQAGLGRPSPSGLIRVGDTKEACDTDNMVRVPSADGIVRIAAGQSRLFRLASVTRDVRWSCFDSAERSANTIAFDWVHVARAGNGALQWIFYRAQAAPASSPSADPRAGTYVHNGSSVLHVGLFTPTGSAGISVPTTLRDILGAMWTDTLSGQLEAVIRALESDSLAIRRIVVADSTNAEFRTRTENGVTVVKYVVHRTLVEAKVTLPDPLVDPNLLMTFDVEVTAPLRLQSDSPFVAARNARARIRYVEIDGADNDANAATALAWAVPRIRSRETALNNAVSQGVTNEVNAGLATALAGAPPGARIAGLASNAAGAVSLCLVRPGVRGCSFNPNDGEPPNRRVLDSTTGQCSQGNLWIRDTERDRFVSIARGQRSRVIELDHRRFEWFCGGDQAPDFRNQEWETGPRETHAVRVSRAATGREVTFQFLHWRAR